MHTNQNKIILDLYSAAQTEKVSDFGQYAIASLMKSVRADSGGVSIFHFDAQGKMFVSGYLSIGVNPEKSRLRSQYLGDELFSSTEIITKDILLKKALKHQNTVHTLKLGKGLGLDNDLVEYAIRTDSMNAMTHFSASGFNVSGINLWRAKQNDVYSQAEIKKANLLMPHIRQAILINQKIASNSLSTYTPNTGSIIAEHHGHIHYIDDVAVILLRKEFPDWLSHFLPKPIIERSGATYVGKHINVQFNVNDSLLFISVVAKEVGKKLTNAELRVVEFVVQFGSYKEAARKLGVSVSTVRNQLHSVYDKLGINNKTELIHFIKR